MLLVGGVALAENVPPDIRINGPRLLFTKEQVFEQDFIHGGLYAIYREGLSSVTLEPTVGNWSLKLESSKLLVDGTGVTSSKVTRSFDQGENFARKELAYFWLEKIELTAVYEFGPRRPGWDFVNSKIFSGPIRNITPAMHDWLDAACKTELEAAEYLYSLHRKDVVNSDYPLSAQNMAWILAVPLSSRSGDALIRYEVGELIYFGSIRTQKPRDPKAGRESIVYSGDVFHAATGAWLGTTIIGATAGEESPREANRQDIENALRRVTPDPVANRPTTQKAAD